MLPAKWHTRFIKQFRPLAAPPTHSHALSACDVHGQLARYVFVVVLSYIFLRCAKLEHVLS